MQTFDLVIVITTLMTTIFFLELVLVIEILPVFITNETKINSLFVCVTKTCVFVKEWQINLVFRKVGVCVQKQFQ
jgi:hypothetical protein